MNFTAQHYFLAISESSSITEAAAKLGISQPALSNWLDNTEKGLGTKLVIRSKKKLSLTPSGRIYAEYSKKILDIEKSTISRMASVNHYQEQEIRIAGTPNGGAGVFAKFFSIFASRYPNVKLQFIESYNQDALELIKNGGADFALCSSIDPVSDIFHFEIKDTRELILMTPNNFPCAYKTDHLAAGEELPTVDLRVLDGMPFIMPSPQVSYYEGVVRLLRHANIRPRVIFQSSNTAAMQKMVSAGNGAAILPRGAFSPVDEVSPFSLRPKLLTYTCVVYRKDLDMTPSRQFAHDTLMRL